MKIFGLIMEANPLHNGHAYFINEIKTKYNPDVLIAVTSTSFCMRGEISSINKFDKTNYLLSLGIDLVFELPFDQSVQSGDYFASNAVNILATLGVNNIICGCETTDIDTFKLFYDLENQDNFKNILKENLNNRLSYKQAFTKSIEYFKIDNSLIDLFNSANFTLAYQYYKCIEEKYPHIKFNLIKRNEEYLSATQIKSDVLNNKEILDLPFDENIIDLKKAYQKLFDLIKYEITVKKVKNDYLNNEGIINYISNNADFSLDYFKLLESLSNKKYSTSRIRRVLLHILLNTQKSYNDIIYLRLLGTNKQGLDYIKCLDKRIKNMIFSNVNEITEEHNSYEILNNELKATKLFEYLTNSSILIDEYKLPIRKCD